MEIRESGPGEYAVAQRASHEQGTTLIAVEAEGKLIEVDQAGKIAWEWQAQKGTNRRLYMGRRLANGNTVMRLSDPGELVEVDRAGEIVRSFGGPDPAIQMGWTSGFTFLPEGGMLINYAGRRIIEVDAKGKLVNQSPTGSRTIARSTWFDNAEGARRNALADGMRWRAQCTELISRRSRRF